MKDAVIRLLSARHAPLAAAVLGLVLCLPSLWTGLAADDFFHRLVLTGNSTLAGVHHDPFDLFVFSSGDPKVGWAQIDAGILGWWADPSVAIAFFRPFATLTHLLDYALFPDSPGWMHAHNLLWFGLGLCSVAAVYRRFVEPRWVATLGLLLYAVDDAHGFVVAWIANRNALIALALGLPVLLLHDAWRSRHRTGAAWSAPLLFAVALLAGESAVAVCAYLLSYAAFMDGASWKQRAGSLAPYGLVLVVWRVVYSSMGYGARGSGLAIDPVAEPLEFAITTLDRLPGLLLGQFAFPPADLWEFYGAVAGFLPALMFGVALVVLALFAAFVWPLLRVNRVARFWAMGTVLAALPACAQLPGDRLLLYTGVGAMALLGLSFEAAMKPKSVFRSQKGWRARRFGAGVLGVIHLPYAAVALPLRAAGSDDVTRMMAKADHVISKSTDVTEDTVILVNPPADAFVGYTTLRRAALGLPLPKHTRWLATGASPVTIRRADARTLLVQPEDGFLSLKSERMQRRPRTIPLGYTIRISEMRVRVTALTGEGRPAVAEIRFDAPLEDPHYRWYRWQDNRFEPFSVPAIGEAVTLPKVDYLLLDR